MICACVGRTTGTGSLPGRAGRVAARRPGWLYLTHLVPLDDGRRWRFEPPEKPNLLAVEMVVTRWAGATSVLITTIPGCVDNRWSNHTGR